MDFFEEIKTTITEALTDAEVHILDPRHDGVHLEALVISPDFRNIPLFKQHQVVMKALKGHFDTTLHALGLKTFTPEAWEEQKHLYLKKGH